MRKYQKVQLALEILQQKGVTLNFAYPPIFLALARQGLPPRPLHFMTPATLYLLGFSIFFLFFGVFLAADIAPEYQYGPIRSLYSLGWGGVTFLSGLSGLVMAIYFLIKSRELKLPAWRDVEKFGHLTGDGRMLANAPVHDPYDQGFSLSARLKNLFIRKKDPFRNITDYTSSPREGRF